MATELSKQLDVQMETELSKQEDVRSRFEKAFKNYKKSPKERINQPYIETRLDILEDLWKEFLVNHKEIVKLGDYKKSVYFKTEFYDTVEDLYMEYKSDLKLALLKITGTKKVETVTQDSSHESSIKMSHVNLPKITIPKFSGDYMEWPSFKDLFTSLIDSNDSLSNIQKLHYLKGSLAGEAEQLVKHVTVLENNYERCWKQLESRYDNKRYLSHCIMKRLLSQRNISVESANELKMLLNTTTDCLEALANLGIPVQSWDIIIIHLITLKLDSESKRQWELSIANSNATDDLPTFEQFKDFITVRYRALDIIEPNKRQSNNNVGPKVFHTVTTGNCVFCDEDHRIAFCKKFSIESSDARREYAKTKHLCFNCLGVNHSAKFCQNKTKCRICNRSHHSLLHPKGAGSTGTSQDGRVRETSTSTAVKSMVAKVSATSVDEPSTVVSCFAADRTVKQIILATALVGAETKRGLQTIRALLDQGSQASFITEATVQFLGLRKIPIKGIISGIGGNSQVSAKSMVEINIHSIFEENVVVKVCAYVLSSITGLLPTKIVSLEWEELKTLQLADPQYRTPNKINILLGAEVYGTVIREGLKRGPNGTPVAQATSLGWIVSGAIKSTAQVPINVVAMHACYLEENDMLKKFWELESDSGLNQRKMLTVEEEKCEKLFTETTKRDSDGRYIVQLPFKNPDDPTMIPSHSREIAERRLWALESKLKRDDHLREEYIKVIKEYLDLGHMEVVPESEINDPMAVYLPHHAVIRADKDTTQVRVVFDAACKGKNGMSLNDALMTGPTLQPDLRHTVLRWRTYPICISADIIKMYRQVKVDEQHVDFQRLVWREEGSSETKHYRLLRLTFGTAPAPYLAVRALQQVAVDEAPSSVTEKVKGDYYMDDLMTGAEDVEEGIQICKEMNEILQKGGFVLQKWTSNCNELLHELKKSEKENKVEGIELNLKTDATIKILGLTWCRDEDSFKYMVKLMTPKKPATKRSIVSDISRLFDPLGWVAPSIVIAKIIIQKLWLAGIDWDEEVPDSLLKEWCTYREELIQLNEIRLPRWFGSRRSDEVVELHGFSDASKLAYAAAVYIRTIDKEGSIHVALVTAKTKVAPVKQVSIPRLELCGAVLSARLLVEVAEVLNIPKSNLHAWTDSTVVLAWINSHPSRWQTFVANRVAEIVTTLDPQQWSHVGSKQNPADCASRGARPSELLQTPIWFSGPDFLRDEVITYKKCKNATTDLEVIKSHHGTVETSILQKYSSLTKLIRVVAYCRRFLKVKDGNKRRNYLTSKELSDAFDRCILLCQQEHFEHEINLLKQNLTVNKKSKIHNLNSFIDNKNILRVGGRLEFSNFDSSQKHPILLPKCNFSNLIIAKAHKATLHGGQQMMLSYLRSQYWILNVKTSIKAHIHKCVTCVRYAKVKPAPLMGQLPAVRATPSRPFANSGVDYAGPINLRSARGRGQHAYKGYICLFVCMCTRAVHIEAVSDLTTQGFLQAYKRFVARRGHCHNLYSDNGTNFLGASRELKRLFQSEKEDITEEVAEALATNGTQWHFIPPHAPNFGGLWEAGIKSVKQHLKRVIGNTTLTYEEMSTVLSQIEACINSRPLSRIDNENDTVTVLTPGHFLTGEAIVTAPEYNYESANVGTLRRWQHTQKMLQDFWRRWSSEYLMRFFHRYRWSIQTPEPEVGDVVLIREDDLPPSRWLYGRIKEKHPGRDNITRVVTLTVKNSMIKRPVSKLIVLPVSS